MGGQSRNPHDLASTPAGSSGGTGVGIAAGYAPLGYGTDTGGSIRGPSVANGIVGMRPTYGLISHDGVIPLSLSLDMAGPMTRNVTDIAVSLGVTAGIDKADPSTQTQKGNAQKDYTRFLSADGLKEARLGLARDYMGADPDVDWVMEASIKAMQRAGATIVDVRLPKWFLDSASTMLWSIYPPEFAVQIGDYLKTTGPKYPKNLDGLIAAAEAYNDLRPDGVGPNPYRWNFFKVEKASGNLTDPGYLAARDHGMPMTRALINGTLAKDRLDAIIYPTSRTRAMTIVGSPTTSGGGGVSPTVIAPLTGLPDLVVTAGFATDDLPVAVSFLGTAYSEPKLLSLGYAFEQATKAVRRPVHTPALPGHVVNVK
jgi:amidase